MMERTGSGSHEERMGGVGRQGPSNEKRKTCNKRCRTPEVSGRRTKNVERRTMPTLFAGALAFGVTLALLGPWARGPASAGAEAPNTAAEDPLPVVQGFEPAVADGGVRPAQPTTIGKATVRAWLGKNGEGQASILVELRSEADAETMVRCRVSLKVFRFPDDVSPMMRMLPEPEISEVFEQVLTERVGAGAVRVVVLPVDADELPEAPEPPSWSPTHGQIIVEALGDA